MTKPETHGSPFRFYWEENLHVCGDCGSERWHANTFYSNLSGWMMGSDAGDPDFWCADCESDVTIIPVQDMVERE